MAGRRAFNRRGAGPLPGGPGRRSTQKPGQLIVAGGNHTSGSIRKLALDLVGGPAARVLIIPHASRIDSQGEQCLRRWRSIGARWLSVLDLEDSAATETLAGADLVWLTGGDQNRLMEALAGTPVPALLRQLRQDGAVIGGTSAGAAVMSKLMLTGNPLAPFGNGLALWPEVIVDQHFLKRGRHERLLAAVRRHPELVGVGIDEDTAVVVSQGSFEVVGSSRVVVLDARRSALEMTVLDPGDEFELEAAAQVSAPAPLALAPAPAG